jgi:hypothetical protein
MKYLLIILLLTPEQDIKSYDVLGAYNTASSCETEAAIENTDSRENRLAICIEDDTPPQN